MNDKFIPYSNFLYYKQFKQINFTYDHHNPQISISFQTNLSNQTNETNQIPLHPNSNQNTFHITHTSITNNLN